MGFRFRRSVKLGAGFRLNVSKSGVGVSGGVRGARIGVGPRGVRSSVGIPGTGLYHISETGWGASQRDNRRTADGSPVPRTQYVDELRKQPPSGNGSLWLLLVGALAIMTPAGPPLILLGALWFAVTRFSNKHRAARCYNAAISQERSGHHEAARDALLDGARFAPADPAIRRFLTVVYHDGLNDIEAAADQAREAIRLAPDDLAMRFALACSLFELQRYDEAIDIFQSLAIPEMEEQCAVLLGRCFYEKQMYDAAIAQFSRCQLTSRTRTDETLMDARYWLGLSYLKPGNTRKAKTQLAKVYAFDVNYRDVAQAMAELGVARSGSNTTLEPTA